MIAATTIAPTTRSIRVEDNLDLAFRAHHGWGLEPFTISASGLVEPGAVAMIDFDVTLDRSFGEDLYHYPLIPKKALNSAEMAESIWVSVTSRACAAVLAPVRGTVPATVASAMILVSVEARPAKSVTQLFRLVGD